MSRKPAKQNNEFENDKKEEKTQNKAAFFLLPLDEERLQAPGAAWKKSPPLRQLSPAAL